MRNRLHHLGQERRTRRMHIPIVLWQDLLSPVHVDGDPDDADDEHEEHSYVVDEACFLTLLVLTVQASRHVLESCWHDAFEAKLVETQDELKGARINQQIPEAKGGREPPTPKPEQEDIQADARKGNADEDKELDGTREPNDFSGVLINSQNCFVHRMHSRGPVSKLVRPGQPYPQVGHNCETPNQ